MNQPTLVRAVLLVVVAVGTLNGCKEHLPEYYGTYINTSGDLKDIKYAKPDDWKISDKTSIIVFDKAVSSPGFNAQNYLSIKPLQWVRYEIESNEDSASPGSDDLRFHYVLKQRIAGSPISLKSKPVSGQTEMVQFEPLNPILPGRYLLEVGGSVYILTTRGVTENGYSAEDPSCVDQRVWTQDINERFSWNAFRKLNQGGLSGATRSSSGNVIMRSEIRPCRQSEEQVEAAREHVRLPSYAKEPARSILLDWLVTQPSLRLAQPADCACDDDLVAMRESYQNDNPYYVTEDLNGDGAQDLAVILIDSEAQGWDAALAVFNGPFGSLELPAYYETEIGTIHSALLFYNPDYLLIGPWAASASSLVPSGLTYSRE